MKLPQTNLNQFSLLLCSNTARLLFVALPLIISSNSIAGANAGSNTTIAYIDSVHQWGAWELDIAPAAGGIQPVTTQALNARNSKLALRTNSVSALAPQVVAATPAVPAIPAIPSTPGIPATPATPAIPAITPISPSVPIPVGAP